MVIVDANDGLSVWSGRLTTSVAGTADTLANVVHKALSRDASNITSGGCIAVPRPSGRRPYALRAVPVRPDGPVRLATSTVLIVIVDPEDQPQPEPEALRRLDGLTRNEADVALRVLECWVSRRSPWNSRCRFLPSAFTCSRCSTRPIRNGRRSWFGCY